MSSSLKTLCVRIPAAPSSLVRCCPKASFSQPQQQQQQQLSARAQPGALALSKTFARANHSLSSTSSGSSFSSSRPSIASLVAKAPSASPTSSSSPLLRLRLRLRLYSSTSGSPASARPPALDWDSFFKLRLRRRRIQLLFSVTTGVLGGAAGTIFLAEGFAEPLIAQIPLDPFFTLGIMTMACAGLGWLIGPTLGNQVFYIINRRFKTQMMQKEGEFFARVKRHRADPTNSSAGNPVPDFYGEKIQSVAGYRRWLKDQRAFNKKKSASFV
ncbi:mitochondrial import protein Pam17 domain-containing protein [Trichoderma ceciliae]